MIPDFQTIMLPFLELLKDGNEHELKELVERICVKFELTDSEREERLPSGSQQLIYNRVGWANTYLKKAQLLEAPRRGTFKITDKGKQLLSSNPKKIDINLLKSLPQFKDWQNSYQVEKNIERDNNSVPQSIEEVDSTKTPEELLEYSFSKLKNELASDLIDKIKSCTPSFFEHLVIDLLITMGYGGSKKEAGQVIGKSGDGGIDGIIKEDKLGLDTIYIQAKRWEATVPVGQIRDFAGSLLSKKAKKGIFITTSNYPKAAYEFVASIEPRIILIDGKELAELMIENNVGISTKTNYEVKRIDLDYFEEN